MKLKLDDAGHVIIKDGHPVYMHEDGKEIAFDGAKAFSKISELTTEAAASRRRAEAAETALKPWTEAGITDPESAIAALATVKNLDQKSLVASGEVEKIRTEAIKATEEKFKPYIKKASDLEGQLNSHMIGGGFKGSKFATEKLAFKGQAGADIAQHLFGSRFKVDGEKVVGHFANGERVFSRSRPGEIADFDEALEQIVDSYAHKDSILAASGQSGGGAPQNGNPGGSGAGKSINRAAFSNLAPAAQQAHFAAGGALVD